MFDAVKSAQVTRDYRGNAFSLLRVQSVVVQRSEGAQHTNEEHTTSLYTPEASSTEPGPFFGHYVVQVEYYSQAEVFILSEI